LPATLALALALLVLSPVRWRCPIAAVAHTPCPTCGMTRAFTLALHGDFAAATAMHPLVWIVVPLVAALLAVEAIGYARTGAWGASARIRGSTAALVAVAVLIFAVWIARFCGALGGPVAV
jgi:hypothetical protein